MPMRILVDPTHYGRETDVDVIAVHGLGAHPVHTWSARRLSHSAEGGGISHQTASDDDDRDPNRVYWLQEFLPEEFPKARIIVFDHNADWIWNAPTTTAAQSAVQMVQDIRSVRDDQAVDPSRPIIFIAHSYGGIIVKQALILSEASQIREATQTIIFLGTPHTGSNTTKLALSLLHCLGLVAWICGSKLLLLKSLEWHSEGLRDLDIEFSKRCPKHISVYCFYETKDSYFGMINLGRIADFTSSTLTGHREGFHEIKIDKNHTSMNKCKDDKDQTFVQICTTINTSIYMAQERRRRLCLEMLANGAQNLRQERINRAVIGTCTWIEGEPVYQNWKADLRSSLFCLLGKAGSGKSTVLSEVLNGLHRECGSWRLSKMLKEHMSELKQTKESRADIVLSSFFFSVEIPGETHYVHMLQSILFQILLQCPTLFSAYERVYEEGKARPWSPEGLEDCFDRMRDIGGQEYRINIFLDAVDECDQPEKVFSIAKSLTREKSHSGLVFKIFLTSRHTNLTIPGPFMEISTQNKPDIGRLIDYGVASIKEILSKSRHDLQWKGFFSANLQKMSDKLHNDANGVILWVALILQRVEKDLGYSLITPDDLVQITETNPAKLDTLYKVIVDKLKSRYEEETHRRRIKAGLSWGAHAHDLLSMQSFITATALAELDNRDGEIIRDNILQHTFMPADPANFPKSLSHIYGGFLELKNESGLASIGLLHRSVRFFLQSHIASPFQIAREDNDELIASSCIQYLKMFVREHSKTLRAQNGESIDEACLNDYVKGLDGESFLPYVFKHLPKHLKNLQKGNEMALAFRNFMFITEPEVGLRTSKSAFLVSLWGRRHNLLSAEESFRGLHWSALPASLLRAAISGGSVTTMKILHAVGCLECDSLQVNALTGALRHRQWAIWDFLTKEAFEGYRLSVKALSDVLHQIIDVGWDKDSDTYESGKSDFEEGDNRLRDNGRNGTAQEDAIVWLLQNGATSKSLSFGQTLLLFASTKGHARLVRLILDSSRGKDLIQVGEDSDKGSALHIAARLGNVDVVDALLKAGAEPKLRDQAGRTPLSYATENEREDIVHLLLAAGAQNEAVGHPRLLLPRQRNQFFKGRGEILSQIEDLLDRKERRPLALVGLGGIGKTEIALEFSCRIHKAFPERFVGWVNAESRHSFEQSHKQMAERIGLSQPIDSIDKVLENFYRWVGDQDDGQSLVIWDNWDEFAKGENDRRERALLSYFVHRTSAKLLITTRNSSLARLDTLNFIQLKSFSTPDARSFLATHLEDESQTDLDLLGQQLGRLPLALAQAAMYIRSTRISVADFIRTFEDTKVYSDAVDYSLKSVEMTLSIQLTVLERDYAPASRLLFLMCCLDPDLIPTNLIRHLCPAVSATAADVNVLHYQSLGMECQQPYEGTAIHRLVTSSMRRTLENRKKLEEFDQKALAIVSDLFPDADYENWKICAMLYPHAKVVLQQNRARTDNVSKDSSTLRQKLGEYLSATGSYREADELLQMAMLEMNQIYGERSLNSLKAAASLAVVKTKLGDYQAAMYIQKQVLEGFLKDLGNSHPDTLTSKANLASTYRSQGHWRHAQALEEQVLMMREKVLGKENPDTLTSMANLASTYRNQGRWEEAKELEMQAIEMSIRILGQDHPFTLTNINNLALTYQCQGRWNEAEELGIQVIEKRKRMLGQEHPDTLLSMNNLVMTYRYQERWNKAAGLGMQVVEMMKRVLGQEHPDTLDSIANLAFIMKNQDKKEEAINS